MRNITNIHKNKTYLYDNFKNVWNFILIIPLSQNILDLRSSVTREAYNCVKELS